MATRMAPAGTNTKGRAMLTRLIEFSLRNRLFVLAVGALVFAYGAYVAARLPVDVFPDLNRPTVTLMTEAPGLAPEEVETLVSLPLETALNGAPGVKRVRATCSVGLSIIYVEFDWGQDIYRARQLVQERIALAEGKLPAGTEVHMGPISSIMGEILLIGLSSESGETVPMELRTLADWQLAPRLLTIPGISQVIVIGGGRKQVQVRAVPERMAAYGVTFDEVNAAAGRAQGSTGGGFIASGAREVLVRNLGRTADPEQIGATVVKHRGGLPIFLRDVAEVGFGIQPVRGNAGVAGRPAVIVGVQKQPGADTTTLTRQVESALAEIRPSLPPDVRVDVLFRQATFIQHAVRNVQEAIRDGALMVAIVLFLFLLNFRTTFITLTAIPLSFAVAALVFDAFEISINTMTLGGLAVAVGMVVDDAIVDVENVYRRLRENFHSPHPRPVLRVIADASREVRNSILFATLVIVLVFLPLFALGGIEGRLFKPIGIATIVAMLASFVVSLTFIPVLCSYLLPRMKRMREKRDGWLVRGLKRLDETFILRPALRFPRVVIVIAVLLVGGSVALYPLMGRAFLPEFNEGTATITLAMAPGTSLDESDRMGRIAEKLLLTIPEIKLTGRRTGRAELDEHAEGVHRSEIDVDLAVSERGRAEILHDIRDRLSALPGILVSVGQPISHRLDHMLSGVQAAIAVKIFGPDLAMLRRHAAQVETVMRGVPGVVDLQVEKQVLIPQVKIQVNRERAALFGLQPGELATRFEAGLNGRVVGQVLEGTRTLDLVVRFAESARADPERLRELLIDTPGGGSVPLAMIADVLESRGPNAISREDAMRRIVISANTAGRDLGSIVAQIQRELPEKVPMASGYFVAYEGQFQSQEQASRLILILSVLTLLVVFLLLYAHFHSGMIVAQVLLNGPLAFVGALVLTYLLIGTVTIATLVGMITLAGIATRNTIMMISHYLHLMQEEGEAFGEKMIIRGSLERLVPVTMTALTAGLALIPLVLAAHEPGKEILYPVAVVILGGLVSSTLLDMAVTPAVFLKFGRRAAERALASRRRDPLGAPAPAVAQPAIQAVP
jgi:CzcA family heavy metal efflux pump